MEFKKCVSNFNAIKKLVEANAKMLNDDVEINVVKWCCQSHMGECMDIFVDVCTKNDYIDGVTVFTTGFIRDYQFDKNDSSLGKTEMSLIVDYLIDTFQDRFRINIEN